MTIHGLNCLLVIKLAISIDEAVLAIPVEICLWFISVLSVLCEAMRRCGTEAQRRTDLTNPYGLLTPASAKLVRAFARKSLGCQPPD